MTIERLLDAYEWTQFLFEFRELPEYPQLLSKMKTELGDALNDRIRVVLMDIAALLRGDLDPRNPQAFERYLKYYANGNPMDRGKLTAYASYLCETFKIRMPEIVSESRQPYTPPSDIANMLKENPQV